MRGLGRLQYGRDEGVAFERGGQMLMRRVAAVRAGSGRAELTLKPTACGSCVAQSRMTSDDPRLWFCVARSLMQNRHPSREIPLHVSLDHASHPGSAIAPGAPPRASRSNTSSRTRTPTNSGAPSRSDRTHPPSMPLLLQHGAPARTHEQPLETPQHKKLGFHPMCRNIRTLHNFEPPATQDEVRAAALQYVRKISGSAKPRPPTPRRSSGRSRPSPRRRRSCSTRS